MGPFAMSIYSTDEHCCFVSDRRAATRTSTAVGFVPRFKSDNTTLGKACPVMANDKCYSSSEAACKAIACEPVNCQVNYSYPMAASCH